MRVSDAQIHLSEEAHEGDPDRGAYPLETMLADMDRADVDRVVLVPTRSDDARSDNAYPFEAARLHPDRLTVMARIDADAPDAPAYLDEMMSFSGMRGLRVHLAREAWQSMDWIWPVAVENDMAIAIFAGRGSFDRLLPILDGYPELRVLLDHVAVPAEGPNPFGDFERVLGLSKYENVTVKCSALTRYSKERYPFHDVQTYVRRLYETFGPQRLAWGSDYSTHAGRVTYKETVDLVRVACDFLTESDREWMLDKTLSRVLRWD